MFASLRGLPTVVFFFLNCHDYVDDYNYCSFFFLNYHDYLFFGIAFHILIISSQNMNENFPFFFNVPLRKMAAVAVLDNFINIGLNNRFSNKCL